MVTDISADSPLVLVVDDEPHMRHVLCRILEREKYRVMSATNGESALKLAEEKSPDVIVLDIMMPGMDGSEVCRRIRGLSPDTQIVYFTGKLEALSALTGIRREADAFIAKPATSRQILSKINDVLQGYRQSQLERAGVTK